MGSKVLIAGGAGFIGSHSADALLAAGVHMDDLYAVYPFAGAPLRNGRPPLTFEGTLQQRDFASVHDVGRACVLAGAA